MSESRSTTTNNLALASVLARLQLERTHIEDEDPDSTLSKLALKYVPGCRARDRNMKKSRNKQTQGRAES